MSKTKELGLKSRLHKANREERGAILDGLPYEVGFGKPPQHTRFTAGNQAGKRGRPKGSENLDTIVREEFDAKIDVNEGGKPRKVSKLRVGILQLANKVASGDIKAFSTYLELLRKTGKLVQPQTGETKVLEPRDLETIERLSKFLGGAETTEPAKETEDA